MDQFSLVQQAIASTFGVDPAEVCLETAQKDIPEWDSVGHLNLMLVLEQTFGLMFDVETMTQLTSVKAILQRMELQ